MRGATTLIGHELIPFNDFNPRTPCGVRRVERRNDGREHVISIHAPHAGCDLFNTNNLNALSQFQSTHPMRGATILPGALISNLTDFNPRTPCGVRLKFRPPVPPAGRISIHAPHAGCDQKHDPGLLLHYNFNPRTPCGVRRLP